MHLNGIVKTLSHFNYFFVMQKECYWAFTAHLCRLCEINIKNNSFTNVMKLAHNSDLFFPSYNEFYIFWRNFPAEQFNICINLVSFKNKRFKTKYWTFEPIALTEDGHFEFFEKRTQQPRLASASKAGLDKNSLHFKCIELRAYIFLVRERWLKRKQNKWPLLRKHFWSGGEVWRTKQSSFSSRVTLREKKSLQPN